ncbi:MAG: methyltransferase domain-containing protein [Candidatus Omnitrophota bacterium]
MANQIDANELSRLYDEGYFHGLGSGYGQAGYECEHGDWTPWLTLAQERIAKNLLWLDAGCAYGYLVQQAQKLGIEAVGVDISEYALRQLPEQRGQLQQALLESLPFRDASFDAVSLFDSIEHSADPESVLNEASRVLKPQGWLFLSTPDPLYFHREEPTHIHERPPSYWIAQLRKRGYSVCLRFGAQPYELEILAVRQPDESWDRIQCAFQGQRSRLAERLRIQGENFHLALRKGAVDGSLQGDAICYLLNASSQPLLLSLELRNGEERHPDIFLGDLKLRYNGNFRQEEGFLHRWNAVPIPPGGCDLTIRIEGAPLPIERLSAAAIPLEREEYLKKLPFDHFQRCRFAAHIVEAAGKSEASILDVGGARGLLPLFLPEADVSVIDVVWEDAPQSLRYGGETLPFADRSFDVVVSLDTLEHIPLDRRQRFLDELCRVTNDMLILSGPYNESHVSEAETVLREFIAGKLNGEDRFLEEHALYTLPDRAETLDVIRSHGFSAFEFPNGFLPRWLSLQLANYALGVAPELAEGKANLNALYNSHYYALDNRYPAYRIAAAACRGEWSPSFKKNFQPLLSAPKKETSTDIWSAASLLVSLSYYGLLFEKESFLNAQGIRIDRLLDHSSHLETKRDQWDEHCQRLLDHIANLDKSLQEELGERKQLLSHSENLDAALIRQQEQSRSLQEHGGNLARLLEEYKKETHNYLDLHRELQKQNSDLHGHIANLDRLHSDREAFFQRLQDHIANLDRLHSDRETFLQRLQDHIANLESGEKETRLHTKNLDELMAQLQSHLTSLSSHIANVEKNAEEWKNHAQNLEQIVSSQQVHAQNLEQIVSTQQVHSKNLENMLDAQRVQIENEQTQTAQLSDRNESLQNHARNLEAMLSSLQTHAGNLEKLLAASQFHAGNLEHILKEKDYHLSQLTQLMENARQQAQILINRIRLVESLNAPDYVSASNIYEVLAAVNDFVDKLESESAELIALTDISSDVGRIQSLHNLRRKWLSVIDEKERLQFQMDSFRSSVGYKICTHIGFLPKPEDFSES